MWLPLFLLFTANSLWGAESTKHQICHHLSQVYRSGILPKIMKGLPFELMATIEQNRSTIFKKILYIQYDLWDEIVTGKDQGQIVFRIAIAQVENPLCQALAPSPTDGKEITGKFRYSVMVNPMWEGRLARLKSSLLDTTKMKIIKINWNNMLYQLPAEEILIDQEFSYD